METKPKTLDLDYPYIRAWGKMAGSFHYYTIHQVRKARREQAPAEAVYFSENQGRWIVFSEVSNTDTRKRLTKIIEEWKENHNKP